MDELGKRLAEVGEKLTHQQQRFVAEYSLSGGPVLAAKLAGYKNPESAGLVQLKKPKVAEACRIIREFILAQRAKRLQKEDITQDRVVLEVARIGFLDPRKLLDSKGKLLELGEMDDDLVACIREIDVRYEDGVDEDGNPTKVKLVNIKLWDKLAALNMLMKYMGLFEKDNRQRPGVQVNVPESSWEALIGLARKQLEVDPIQEQIQAIDVEAKPVEE